MASPCETSGSKGSRPSRRARAGAGTETRHVKLGEAFVDRAARAALPALTSLLGGVHESPFDGPSLFLTLTLLWLFAFNLGRPRHASASCVRVAPKGRRAKEGCQRGTAARVTSVRAGPRRLAERPAPGSLRPGAPGVRAHNRDVCCLPPPRPPTAKWNLPPSLCTGLKTWIPRPLEWEREGGKERNRTFPEKMGEVKR